MQQHCRNDCRNLSCSSRCVTAYSLQRLSRSVGSRAFLGSDRTDYIGIFVGVEL